MEYYLVVLSILMIICMLMALFNKATYTKILIFTQVNNMATLFIAMLSSYQHYNLYIDIALIYAFLSFIAIKSLIYYENNKK